MKVKKFRSVELAITEFDDGVVWVHVDLRQSGQLGKTLYQAQGLQTLRDEDLDHALVWLDELAQQQVNHFRHKQQLLF